MSSRPSQVAAEALTDDDAPIDPLGTVRVSTSGTTTLVVSIPIGAVREHGLEQGDEFHVGHLPSENAFVYVPANYFGGW